MSTPQKKNTPSFNVNVGIIPQARGTLQPIVALQDERTLGERDLDTDPHRQFRKWLQEATDAGEPMPAAMALATVDAEGLPWVRMMLLEEVDERGFAFQTNLGSPKASHLARQPHAALTFFWPRLVRQVRVTGSVEPLTRTEAAAFFDRMPPGIQAMVRASPQSEVIPDRAALDSLYAAALASPTDRIPEHWGGYRLRADSIEFWQGRPNWLQDRLRYSRSGDAWRIERLVP